ncbi:MAG TPA: diaminopimelate decarboxylase, partial [Thiothrix sp.]|nr:diaminopimelate decarboxylase [Thiothrix sp.]
IDYGWSYKTNYLNTVCSILHQEGAWAEVVSIFEYEKARALGVPAHRILFNGPHKSKATLERCVAEGARLHIDNTDELYLLESVAQAAEKTIDVTIRLNFDTGYTEPWSRFGFNIESGAAMNAAQRIGSSQWLELCGLHSHIGTFVLDPRAYASQVKIMCAFMEAAEQQTGCLIDSIDIGGGFASRNDLHGMYQPAEQIVPSIEQYADAICTTLIQETQGREACGKPRPTLIMESGRSIIDDAEVLISSVVSTRRLPDGRAAAVIDAGVNLLFTAFWYNHRIQTTRPLDGLAEDTVLYGPLCMNIDVIRQSIMIPPLSVGDSLVISPVGAYNNTQWMQFIEYRPAIVMIHEDGQVSVIREAEDLSFINQLEHIPEHVQGNHQY